MTAVAQDTMAFALRPTYPYYLANRPQQPNADMEVTNKYTGEVATRVARADESVVREAIAAAVAAQPAMAALAAYERKAILMHVRRQDCYAARPWPRLSMRTCGRARWLHPRPCPQLVRQFEERHEELAQALCIEAGKPIKSVCWQLVVVVGGGVGEKAAHRDSS